MFPDVGDERCVLLVLNPKNLHVLKSSKCRYSQVQHPSILACSHDIFLFVYFPNEVSDIERTKAVLQCREKVLYSFPTYKLCQLRSNRSSSSGHQPST
jgi:hypothetical protein